MTWAVFALGLLLATLGATAGSALIATSRAELARFAATQLRGGGMPLARLAEVERLLIAASSTTSLGALLLGAALVGLLAGAGRITSMLVLLLVGIPAVVVGGYLLPRLFATRRAEQALRATLPVLRPWSALLALLLPSDGPGAESRFRAILRGGAAVDPDASGELELVGGVLTFAERPVREVMTPRTDIVAIAEDASKAEIGQAFAQSGYSRLPVYRGTLDEIVGHAARVRPVPAGTGCAAPGATGRHGAREPRLWRPAHRHAAGTTADVRGARRVWRHRGHRHAR